MKQVYVPYDSTDQRPSCGICGPATRKRAVFFDRQRQRPLCARCAVAKIADKRVTA